MEFIGKPIALLLVAQRALVCQPSGTIQGGEPISICQTSQFENFHSQQIKKDILGHSKTFDLVGSSLCMYIDCSGSYTSPDGFCYRKGYWRGEVEEKLPQMLDSLRVALLA